MQCAPSIVVGFDVGGSTFRASGYEKNQLTTDSPKSIATIRRRFETPPSSALLLEMIKESIESIKEKTQKDISHVGFGIAAWIEQPKGNVIHSPHLDLKQFDLKFHLKNQYPNIVFSVNNDLSAIAVAEHHYGVGKNFNHVAVVYFGTGLGCGLILNGKLYEGRGLAGEIGHVRFQHSSNTTLRCACGENNCIEAFTGGKAIAQRLSNHFPKKKKHTLDGHFIDELLKNGNAHCKMIIDEACLAACQAVTQLTQLLDPEAVVIGGGLFGHSKAFKMTLMERLPSSLNMFARKNTVIAESKLGDEAGMLGAARPVSYTHLTLPTICSV